MKTEPLEPADFAGFFSELHGYAPFPWQIELARRACAGNWPEYLAVPTGSGKTAALDAAIFALAVQSALPPAERTLGRRIFYVVNRRVIVDEAYERACYIASSLRSPKPDAPIVARVANCLRTLNPDAGSPLDCVQLRGGIYRDQRWARSLTQPLIVASTVDQVGSRLLFSGYGVSASMRPIHAALVAHDSLLLLDEAHISRPFAQTLTSIAAYRARGSARPTKPSSHLHATVVTPFTFLQMTATPPADTAETAILRLSENDRINPTLAARLHATKPTVLLIAKTSGVNALKDLATALADQATKIITKLQLRSIAVFVNRVVTARYVAQLLANRFSSEQVTLLIGRMRPLDRDDITKHLREELKTLRPGETAPSTTSTPPLIIVATQCLEVGADFDFDAIVTECASLDALRQRFGRLNRGGRAIHARAVIIVRSDQVSPDNEDLEANPKASDPIYGTSLGRTWNWLNSVATDGIVDFGVKSIEAHVEAVRKADKTDIQFRRMLSPTKDAPILLPAYLDAWSQTSPAPSPQPEPALFLHGPGRGDADVQVCWRTDLPEAATPIEDWIDTVSLCPPTTVECLTVPLSEFRRWFVGGNDIDNGDVLDTPVSNFSEIAAPVEKTALVWRGLHESYFLEPKSPLCPGDTIILRAQDGDLESLGHLPGATVANVDQAERAFRQTKQREILRLRQNFFPDPAKDSAIAELLNWSRNANCDWTIDHVRDILLQASRQFAANEPISLALKSLSEDKLGPVWEPYPDGQGLILKTRNRVVRSEDPVESDDDGNDSLLVREDSIPRSLPNHSADVVAETKRTLRQLPLVAWNQAIETAAEVHDWGKADERFQALLLNGTPAIAWAQSELFAKSWRMPRSAAAYEAARRRAALPRGFRHEMLSVQMAEANPAASHLPDDELLRALVLHLIASHHGYARPFAPIVTDDTPPSIEFESGSTRVGLDAAFRIAGPAHRIDSGIADRFWQLNRHFGWWGLAYLETVLRLADQQASANP